MTLVADSLQRCDKRAAVNVSIEKSPSATDRTAADGFELIILTNSSAQRRISATLAKY